MPIVFSETEAVQASAKTRLMLCGLTDDSVAAPEAFRAQGNDVVLANISSPIPVRVRTLLSTVDIVLLDITEGGNNTVNIIHELNAAIGICSFRPRLLCFSSAHRNPQFVLGVQKSGARYVRVSSPEMVLEAIDLLIAEINELEKNGPRFRIVHRYSQGICAPGEEISAVLFEYAERQFQLPLGLTERFVFDFIAQRRLAVDSLQIVSGLTGDRFYSQHAANSGCKQIRKIRRPTIKVSAQRIRDAMGSTFIRAKTGFDPYRVLRSCFAEGTNRVLYKLCSQVHWQHPSR